MRCSSTSPCRIPPSFCSKWSRSYHLRGATTTPHHLLILSHHKMNTSRRLVALREPSTIHRVTSCAAGISLLKVYSFCPSSISRTTHRIVFARAHSLLLTDMQLLWLLGLLPLAPTAFAQASNDSDALIWGAYRPNLYFGLRPRFPQSLMTGLMWYGTHDYQSLGRM